MTRSDEGNLTLVTSTDAVDQLNTQFYEMFPYPERAIKFDYLEDCSFETVMLNQELGDWGHRRIPPSPRVWVAGCGTNQAIFTALRFTGGMVLGSDLSSTSLETCARTAALLGITNLELKQQNINHVNYRDEFDYIISTGVIHHNADPRATLLKFFEALKPGGVLELMVYNRFHMTVPAAFQKALRLFGRDSGAPDFNRELSLTKKIIRELPQESSTGVISSYRDNSVVMLADELLQPVLHHYTVESLAEMAESCGLELMLPCLNQFDKADEKLSWNIVFKDEELREIYDAMPDVRRWQMTNLLLREKSPQLWFYLQRRDSGQMRKTEREVSKEFLEQIFVRAETAQRSYLQKKEGNYILMPRPLRYPVLPPDPAVKKIIEAVDAQSPMWKVFLRLSLDTSFAAVHRTRLLLTTPQFPYLKAVH